MVPQSVPSAGRPRGTSAPGPDPTEGSLPVLTPRSVIIYPAPFISVLHRFIYLIIPHIFSETNTSVSTVYLYSDSSSPSDRRSTWLVLLCGFYILWLSWDLIISCILFLATYVFLSAIIAELAFAEMEMKVNQLLSLDRLRGDSRLFYFGAAAPSSSGKHSLADNYIDTFYRGRCVLCGAGGATRAHLVSGSHETTYPEFGIPTYSDNLDVKSVRNFIPLCGTKGMKGSCHDAFDTFRLTILFNPFGNNYYCYCLHEQDFRNYNALHMKTVVFHEDHKPYRRLLAWHARKCFNEHPYWVSREDIPRLLSAVDLSETKSVELSGRSSSTSSW